MAPLDPDLANKSKKLSHPHSLASIPLPAHQASCSYRSLEVGGKHQELAKKYNIFSSILPRYRVIDLFGCGYAAPGILWVTCG